MEALTPASADDLPPIAELIADEPFWRHPAWGLAGEGVAHMRIWTTAAVEDLLLEQVRALARQGSPSRHGNHPQE